MTFLGYGMQWAINLGVLDPEEIVVPVTCPTGNCTFGGSYKSVGYCSRCNDTSSQLKITTEKI